MGIGFFLWNTEAISLSLTGPGMLRKESASLSLEARRIADPLVCFSSSYAGTVAWAPDATGSTAPVKWVDGEELELASIV